MRLAGWGQWLVGPRGRREPAQPGVTLSVFSGGRTWPLDTQGRMRLEQLPD